MSATMLNEGSWTDRLTGNWNVVKGRLKQSYANLTEDDLLYEEGKEDELVGRLQRRLGKTKDEIHHAIDRFLD